MSAVRVLLVDDHRGAGGGLNALLSSQDNIVVVAEAASGGEEAVALVPEAKPDVVLMDLRLGAGGIDGARATAEIMAAADPPRVVVLTTYDTDTDILRAVEAGAAGYLLKDADPKVLIESVFAASRGGKRSWIRTWRSASTVACSSPRADLSAREIEVLSLVAEGGLSNRAIAKRLFVSEATVKSHLVHAFTKLDVDNRTAAVVAARERGLIS